MNTLRLVLSVSILSVSTLSGPIAVGPGLSDPAEETSEKLARFMEMAAEEGFTGTVIVATGNRILLQEGYGRIDPDEERPVRPDTVFTTGSITKQFTAAAIMKLEQEGKLSVDDPIGKYLPDVPQDKQAITLHLLLTHQAGFPGAIGDDREPIGREEFAERAMNTRLLFKPGEQYEYSNVGYSLAAAIVEMVSGDPYEVYLRRELFQPAGMKDTGYSLPAWDPTRLAHGWTDDGGDWGTVVGNAFGDSGPGWNLVGNGGIHSTAEDMMRWHRALTGDRILTPASREKLYGRYADEGGGTWYGYGWSIEETEWGLMLAHNGGNPYFFADYLRFPGQDVVIYYATSSRERRMHRLARKLAGIVFTGGMAQLDPVPAPMIPAGQGPPAEEGSAAAKWGFPGSYRGQRAGELLEAIVNGDEEERRAFIGSGFTPDIVKRNGVDKLLSALDGLREEMGEFEVRGLRPEGPGRVVVVIDSSSHKGALMHLEIDLEPEKPHRIAGIGVQVGG